MIQTLKSYKKREAKPLVFFLGWSFRFFGLYIIIHFKHPRFLYQKSRDFSNVRLSRRFKICINEKQSIFQQKISTLKNAHKNTKSPWKSRTFMLGCKIVAPIWRPMPLSNQRPPDKLQTALFRANISRATRLRRKLLHSKNNHSGCFYSQTNQLSLPP